MQRMRVGGANGLGIKYLARSNATTSASSVAAGKPARS